MVLYSVHSVYYGYKGRWPKSETTVTGLCNCRIHVLEKRGWRSAVHQLGSQVAFVLTLDALQPTDLGTSHEPIALLRWRHNAHHIPTPTNTDNEGLASDSLSI